MSFRYRFCRVMGVVSNAWICHPEVGFIFLFQKQRYPYFCKLRSITVLHFCLQCAESAKKRRYTAISLLLSVSFLFTCHHPPTPHNILIDGRLMADTVYDFTHPSMSALLAGYRSISARLSHQGLIPSKDTPFLLCLHTGKTHYKNWFNNCHKYFLSIDALNLFLLIGLFSSLFFNTANAIFSIMAKFCAALFFFLSSSSPNVTSRCQ